MNEAAVPQTERSSPLELKSAEQHRNSSFAISVEMRCLRLSLASLTLLCPLLF